MPGMTGYWYGGNDNYYGGYDPNQGYASGTDNGNYGGGSGYYDGSYIPSGPANTPQAQTGGFWNQAGQWVADNGMQLAQTGLAMYNSWDAAQQQQAMADFYSQPQNQYGYSGIDLGQSQPFFDYFLNEIPRLYEHMQGQSGQGGPRVSGPGGLSTGLARDMADYARADDPRLNAAGDWMTGMFDGPPNAWMQTSFDNAQGGPLMDFINQSMGAAFGGPGGGGGGGGYGGGGGFYGGGGGGYGASIGETAMGNFAGGLNGDIMNSPIVQQLLAAQDQAINSEFAGNFADVVGNASSAGRYGSGAYNALQGNNYRQAADALAAARPQAALAMINPMLQAAQGNAGAYNQRQGDALAANTSSSNAAMSANASRYGTDQAFRSAMAGMGLDAIMGQQGAMSGLGNDWAGYQLAAAGLLPQYHNIPMADLQQAFGANMNLDQMRQQASQANAAAWGRQQQMPWQNLQNAMGMLMPMANLYGTQWNQAQMPGQYIPTMSDGSALTSGLLTGGASSGLFNTNGQGG